MAIGGRLGRDLIKPIRWTPRRTLFRSRKFIARPGEKGLDLTRNARRIRLAHGAAPTRYSVVRTLLAYVTLGCSRSPFPPRCGLGMRPVSRRRPQGAYNLSFLAYAR